MDDGVCEESPTGAHDLQIAQMALDERATLNQVHECRFCGAVAYEASDDPTTRPPL